MGFIKEFKEFAIKGNVMDMAVGIIIGAAFGKIIDSIVNDLVMPLVSSIVGTPDFTNLYTVLKGDVATGLALEEARKVEGAIIFAYGNFITILINFLLLAFVVFLLVKGVNNMRKQEEAAPAEPSSTDKLLAEIRDELKNKS